MDGTRGGGLKLWFLSHCRVDRELLNRSNRLNGVNNNIVMSIGPKNK